VNNLDDSFTLSSDLSMTQDDRMTLSDEIHGMIAEIDQKRTFSSMLETLFKNGTPVIESMNNYHWLAKEYLFKYLRHKIGGSIRIKDLVSGWKSMYTS
jgi:hypothetical protein